MAEEANNSKIQSLLTVEKNGQTKTVTETHEPPTDVTQKTQVENRAIWVSKFYSKPVKARSYFREFMDFRNTKQPRLPSASTEKNADKCRYTDIHCIENTRVILQQRSADKNFIHANWMKMPDGFRYISTQGPLESTTEDFWHMVITEKVQHILMICDFVEGDTPKCAMYIPRDKGLKTFGVYKVKRISGEVKMIMEDVKHQKLEVTHKSKSSVKAVVNHYQYVNWPDHSTPASPDSVIKLHRIFRNPANTHPVVVHCSAGIGRTATFIALDYGYQRIGETPDVSMLDLVRDMRKMRDKSVQSPNQYLFIIVAITELLCREGISRNENVKAFVEFHASRQRKKAEARKDEKNDE